LLGTLNPAGAEEQEEQNGNGHAPNGNGPVLIEEPDEPGWLSRAAAAVAGVASGEGRPQHRRRRDAPSHAAAAATALATQHAVHEAAQQLPQLAQEVRSQFWDWAAPILGIIYLISPLDVIPDFLPLIGWLDDMIVLGAVIYFLFSVMSAQQRAAQAHGGH